MASTVPTKQDMTVDCRNEHEDSVEENEIAILDDGNADKHNLCSKCLGKRGEEPVTKKPRYDDKTSGLVDGTTEEILEASVLDVTLSAKKIRETDSEKVSSPAGGALVNDCPVEKKAETSTATNNLAMSEGQLDGGYVSSAAEPKQVDEDCVSSGSTTSLRGLVPRKQLGDEEISKPEAESSEPMYGFTLEVNTDDKDADDPGTDSDNEGNLIIDIPPEEASTTNENELTESKEHGKHTAFDVENSIQSVASLERKDNESISNPVTMSAPTPLIRGTLSKLTIQDLEELIVQKICECDTGTANVEELRRRVETLESEVDKWKEKASSCNKQRRDLGLVMKKLKADCNLQNKERSSPVAPTIVKRSVGLKVNFGARSLVLKPAPLRPSIPSTAQKTSNVVKSAPSRAHFNTRPLLPKPLLSSSQPKKTIPRASTSAKFNIIDINLTGETKSPFTANAAKNTPSSSKVVVFAENPAQALKSIISDGIPENKTAMLVRCPAQMATGKGRAYRHPAPPPYPPIDMRWDPSWKFSPPQPVLTPFIKTTGVVLSWDMEITSEHEPISSYQIIVYKEEENKPPSSAFWKKFGDVPALPLPLSCSVGNFELGRKYHFAVRAVDVQMRVGPFSEPSSIFAELPV